MYFDYVVDLIIAGILLVIAVTTSVIVPADKGFVYSTERIEMSDEDDLFLLNFLKTEVELANGKRVVDLIIEGENNQEEYEALQAEVQRKFQGVAGFSIGSFGVRISYPGQEDRYLGAGFEIPGSVIKLPSLNDGTIEVEANLITEEEKNRELSR